MLVLLVSFVVTIPALTNAVHINLPKTVTTTPPEQQKAITVTVDSEGRVYLDNQETPFERLLPQLQGLKASNSRADAASSRGRSRALRCGGQNDGDDRTRRRIARRRADGS